MSIGAGGKLVRFTDGQGVANADLNGIGAAAQCASWEWPGFMGLNIYGDPYGVYGDYPFTVNNYDDKVYTYGGGCMVFASTKYTKILPGFLGMWHGAAATPTPIPVPTALSSQMRWVQFVVDTVVCEHPATSAGQYRWDLVCLTIADAGSDAATRPFKDSTTGAYTAQSINQSTLTSCTGLARQGTEGASEITCGPIPAAQTGDHVIAAALIHDNAVIAIRDLTIPFGVTHRCRMMPSEAYFQASGATDPADKYLNTAVSMVVNDDPVYFLPPATFRDQDALLVGVTVGGSVPPSPIICEVGQFIPSTSPSTWAKAASLVTSGGDAELSTLTYNVDLGGRFPVWGNGLATRASSNARGFLALKIQGASGVPVPIYSITWQFKR